MKSLYINKVETGRFKQDGKCDRSHLVRDRFFSNRNQIVSNVLKISIWYKIAASNDGLGKQFVASGQHINSKSTFCPNIVDLLQLSMWFELLTSASPLLQAMKTPVFLQNREKWVFRCPSINNKSLSPLNIVVL